MTAGRPTDYRRCSIDGCERRHEARGYCQKHYLRSMAHGDPLDTPGRRDRPVEERFADRVELIPFTTCHMWNEGSNRGYGQFTIDGKNLRPHRVAYELHKGPIPEGMLVCHSCDQPGCVNPDHLFLGTPQQNMDDKENKGRGRYPRGEDSGKTHLTDGDIREIRSMSGNASQGDIALMFGLSRPAVSMIINKKRWKHVA